MKNGDMVLVTTELRGVFYGKLAKKSADSTVVVLKDAKCAIYWGTSGGFLELASKGPNSSSRIGSQAPEIELVKVSSVVKCSDDAVKAWSKQ